MRHANRRMSDTKKYGRPRGTARCLQLRAYVFVWATAATERRRALRPGILFRHFPMRGRARPGTASASSFESRALCVRTRATSFGDLPSSRSARGGGGGGGPPPRGGGGEGAAHGARSARSSAVLRAASRRGTRARSRVEREIELVLPAELEARLRKALSHSARRESLGQVGGVRRDLVRDHAGLHVVAIGSPRCSFGVT
jgi:hypothetical protein